MHTQVCPHPRACIGAGILSFGMEGRRVVLPAIPDLQVPTDVNIRLAHGVYKVVSKTHTELRRLLGGQCSQSTLAASAVVSDMGLSAFRHHLSAFSGRIAYFLTIEGIELGSLTSSDDDEDMRHTLAPEDH
jgi:hypothetical protein